MINIVEKYQGLIFDMDGTLIDTMPAHLQAWEVTATQFGFPFSSEWIHSLGGMPSYKIVAEVNKKHGVDLDPKEVSEFKMATFAQFDNHGENINQTNELLNHFRSTKRIAVGTGSQRESALRLLTKNGILDKLDAVVTSSDVENHKPFPDTFLKAARELGLTAKECVVFEDTKLGMQAAHAAEMDCIMVEGDELVFYPLTR